MYLSLGAPSLSLVYPLYSGLQGRGTPYPGLLCKDQRVAASRACSLLRGASDPDEFVRDMSLNMLSRLKATYPQVCCHLT